MDTLSSVVDIPISSIIPHRGEMLLLDKLISHDRSSTVCEVQIQPKSIFAQQQGVPAWVSVEYMAQAVSAHDGLESKEKSGQIGFLISIRKARFFVDFFRPLKTLRVSVRHVWGDRETFTFTGEVHDSQTNAILSEAQLNFYKPKDLKAFQNERLR